MGAADFTSAAIRTMQFSGQPIRHRAGLANGMVMDKRSRATRQHNTALPWEWGGHKARLTRPCSLRGRERRCAADTIRRECDHD